MRPSEFWALAIFCAVLQITASGSTFLVLQVVAYVAALCALIASYKRFQRELLAGQGVP